MKRSRIRRSRDSTVGAERVVLHPLTGTRFRVEVDRELLGALRRALPLGGSDWAGGADATLSVVASPVFPTAPPTAPPTVRVGRVAAWIDLPRRDQCVLRSTDAIVSGTLDLAIRRGTLRVRARVGRSATTALPAPEVRSAARASTAATALGVAAALLLGRLRRLVIHAGAAVAPDGRAQLLVGDAGAGKSTTCATLIAAGWDYLADDQVVIGPGARVEGWQSEFRLDRGWRDGIVTGTRVACDPLLIGQGRLRRTAPLGDCFFLVVRPTEATRAVPMTPMEAFARLVRHSPAYLADPIAVPVLSSVLGEITARRCWRLVVGCDALGRSDVLVPLLTASAVRPPAITPAR